MLPSDPSQPGWVVSIVGQCLVIVGIGWSLYGQCMGRDGGQGHCQYTGVLIIGLLVPGCKALKAC